jgi:hypothetical protein
LAKSTRPKKKVLKKGPSPGEVVAQKVKEWCAQKGLPIPQTEGTFHPVRKWRFDLFWPEQMVAMEIHGAVFRGRNGRHTSGKGYTNDRVKCNEAQLLGWLVLEVTYGHVRDGYLFDALDRALLLRGAKVSQPKTAGTGRKA